MIPGLSWQFVVAGAECQAWQLSDLTSSVGQQQWCDNILEEMVIKLNGLERDTICILFANHRQTDCSGRD